MTAGLAAIALAVWAIGAVYLLHAAPRVRDQHPDLADENPPLFALMSAIGIVAWPAVYVWGATLDLIHRRQR
ncbi:MAG: hypothetical protein HOV68_17715 [Streptomycetaceae bacterium]|nr:hypothetical protein [Streptomycetaceae bacterium]